MDYDLILKRNRKSPILDMAADGLIALDYAQDMIKKIIPHRDPFLLVDRLIALDLSEGKEAIAGERYIDPKDPVFQGHFPDYPVYPGCLQGEMSAQLGVCLSHFIREKTTKITQDCQPKPVRGTKVLGALFLEPVEPGQTVTILAQSLDFDGYFWKVLTQVIAGGKVSCVSITEGYFLTD